MMSCSYDESYLPLSQRILGDMYDYAVNTLSFGIKQYHRLFIVSGIARQFEIGNPTYVAGMNGCEVAREVISSCTDRTPAIALAMPVYVLLLNFAVSGLFHDITFPLLS